jgi:hypothetical protein
MKDLVENCAESLYEGVRRKRNEINQVWIKSDHNLLRATRFMFNKFSYLKYLFHHILYM